MYVLFATVLAAVVALSACGGDDDDTPSADNTTTVSSPGGGTKPQTTELGQGVTDGAIKLGIVIVDYDNEVISANVDFSRGDQEAIYQAFVDDLNKNGGIGGRQIEPVYEVYAPLGSDPPMKACTRLTEDEKVFATLGVLIDFAGAAQVCFAKTHESILLTHELSQGIVDKATPGLLLTTDTLAERASSELLQSAFDKGLLTGKKFGILSDAEGKSRIDDVVEPKIKDLGLEVGTAGVLNIDPSGDTTAAQAQLDSFIERWKNEDVTALFISGLATVDNQFVQKIKNELPDLLLLTDGDASAKGAAQDLVNAGTTPNPYQGMLALIGLTDQEQFETPSLQECVKVWETASGDTVVAPKDLKAGSDGKRAEIWITVRDACSDLKFFKDIAERVGQYLNNDNWIDAVNNFGEIEVVASTAASLGEGKYDAGDGGTLKQFDTEAGTAGDWAPVP
jgi:hypothetical protein